MEAGSSKRGLGIDPGDNGNGGDTKKSKHALNCAECRRLKVKCDRNVPCNGCVKRGCAELCPDESLVGVKKLIQQRSEQARRIEVLEQDLANAQANLAHFTSTPPSPNNSTRQIDGTLNTIYDRHVPLSPMISRHLPDLTLHHTGPSTVQGPSEDVGRNEGQSRPVRQFWSHRDDAERRQHDELDGGLGTGSNRLRNSEGGTLVVDQSGGYKYIGLGAGSEWLRDNPMASQPVSRATSPRLPTSSGIDSRSIDHHPFAFPFHVPEAPSNTLRYFISQLPTQVEVNHLADCYFTRIGWISTPIDRDEYDVILQRFYVPLPGEEEIPKSTRELRLHELAMIYASIALGILVDMDLPPHDAASHKYFILAQQCLSAGRFLRTNTIPSLQALTMMAMFSAYAKKSLGWDIAWVLWGLATRIMQAMGLHRDGSRWDLEQVETDRRRRLFWEIFVKDVLMSNNWDRPNSMDPSKFDTRIPSTFEPGSHYELRCHLGILAKSAADEVQRLPPPPFSRLKEIWTMVVQFEDELPFYIRCRAAALALVSRYGTQRMAEEATPEPSKDDLGLCFQQHHLSLNICTIIVSVFRSSFVAAIQESPSDPAKSIYGEAYLAVFERSTVLIALLKSLHSLFPLTCRRHWFFWSHAFSAAVCMATVCITCPTSPLTGLAFADLSSIVDLFSSVRDTLPRESTKRDLEWLTWLRGKAHTTLTKQMRSGMEMSVPTPPAEADENALELVGWTTRLVKRGIPNSANRANIRRSAGGALGLTAGYGADFGSLSNGGFADIPAVGPMPAVPPSLFPPALLDQYEDLNAPSSELTLDDLIMNGDGHDPSVDDFLTLWQNLVPTD